MFSKLLYNYVHLVSCIASQIVLYVIKIICILVQLANNGLILSHFMNFVVCFHYFQMLITTQGGENISIGSGTQCKGLVLLVQQDPMSALFFMEIARYSSL